MRKSLHLTTEFLPRKWPCFAIGLREWVGLTDADIAECMEMSIQKTCRAVEQLLKEKNG